jgi:AraC family transcriptional regulator
MPRALERIWWMRAGSSHPEPIPSSLLCRSSGPGWRDVHVEEHTAAPGQVPAGSYAGHLLALNVGSAYRLDVTWSGASASTDHVLCPGNFALIPAGLTHAVAWWDPATSVLVELSTELVDSLARERPMLRPCLNRRDNFVSHAILALRDLARDSTEQSAACGEALGAVLAAYLVSHERDGADVGHPEARSLSSAGVRRVFEFVDANLEREISLMRLAQECGTSVFHFARLFKRRTGVAPHQFIVQRRIERARSLLRNADLSVGEVAARCGFAQQSHFATTFRRVVGLSPTSYRRLL